MKVCGEPDKPEVKKHIEDLDNAWDNITALFAKREENLINAMEKAMEFHETLQVCINPLFVVLLLFDLNTNPLTGTVCRVFWSSWTKLKINSPIWVLWELISMLSNDKLRS